MILTATNMKSDKRRFVAEKEEGVTFEPYTPTTEEIAYANELGERIKEEFSEWALSKERNRPKLDE